MSRIALQIHPDTNNVKFIHNSKYEVFFFNGLMFNDWFNVIAGIQIYL